MDATTHAKSSMSLILQALGYTTRSAFATEAGIAESSLRKLGSADWNPKFQVLITCECAAKRIIADWQKRHGAQR